MRVWVALATSKVCTACAAGVRAVGGLVGGDRAGARVDEGHDVAGHRAGAVRRRRVDAVGDRPGPGPRGRDGVGRAADHGGRGGAREADLRRVGVAERDRAVAGLHPGLARPRRSRLPPRIPAPPPPPDRRVGHRRCHRWPPPRRRRRGSRRRRRRRRSRCSKAPRTSRPSRPARPAGERRGRSICVSPARRPRRRRRPAGPLSSSVPGSSARLRCCCPVPRLARVWSRRRRPAPGCRAAGRAAAAAGGEEQECRRRTRTTPRRRPHRPLTAPSPSPRFPPSAATAVPAGPARRGRTGSAHRRRRRRGSSWSPGPTVNVPVVRPPAGRRRSRSEYAAAAGAADGRGHRRHARSGPSRSAGRRWR